MWRAKPQALPHESDPDIHLKEVIRSINRSVNSSNRKHVFLLLTYAYVLLVSKLRKHMPTILIISIKCASFFKELKWAKFTFLSQTAIHSGLIANIVWVNTT